MHIIENITIKKELKNLFIQAKLTDEQLKACLQPSRNVYYHYSYVIMRLTNQNQETTLEDIQTSMSSFNTYLNQLLSIKTNINAILTEHTRLKGRFYNDYQELQKYFSDLEISVHSLMINIKELPDYHSYPEFRLILNFLFNIRHELSACSHSKVDDIYSQTTVMV